MRLFSRRRVRKSRPETSKRRDGRCKFPFSRPSIERLEDRLAPSIDLVQRITSDLANGVTLDQNFGDVTLGSFLTIASPALRFSLTSTNLSGPYTGSGTISAGSGS